MNYAIIEVALCLLLPDTAFKTSNKKNLSEQALNNMGFDK